MGTGEGSHPGRYSSGCVGVAVRTGIAVRRAFQQCGALFSGRMHAQQCGLARVFCALGLDEEKGHQESPKVLADLREN